MHTVIIGNGISGVSAARKLRKISSEPITIVSSETPYFYSRTALMYVYMGHMRPKDLKPYEDKFWGKNNIDLIFGHVSQIDFSKKLLLSAHGNFKDVNDGKKASEIKYDKLVLALGSATNKFGWPGQDLKAVCGMYSWQDLESIEAHSKNLKRAVIVGGGLIGIELAEMFHSRNIEVSFLVREKSYWENVLPVEESEMINKEIKDHHVDLQLGTELKEIISDQDGKACAVLTSKSQKIDCGFVGLTAGVHPNVGFLKNTELVINKGIVVNEYLETNIADVYAIGDCAEIDQPLVGRRGVEAIWYTGRMMGELVAHNIVKSDSKLAYDPGTWFNSAKFFNIEYQVYGAMPAKLDEGVTSLFWQDNNQKRSLRINFDDKSKAVTGFNALGVRLRHEVCAKWIEHKASIEDVLQNLELADFEPEFYEGVSQEMRQSYYNKTGNKLAAKSSRKLNLVQKFLNR